ncbi:MAG: hypothetical protein AAF587_37725 [Bacteroidota bacterium]
MKNQTIFRLKTSKECSTTIDIAVQDISGFTPDIDACEKIESINGITIKCPMISQSSAIRKGIDKRIPITIDFAEISQRDHIQIIIEPIIGQPEEDQGITSEEALKIQTNIAPKKSGQKNARIGKMEKGNIIRKQIASNQSI